MCVVLDEPTNDLDTETLELLEELLVDYPGTVLMVSHDREFLNHVVTSTIAFEGAARWKEYDGGYEDWLRQRPAPAVAGQTPRATGRKPSASTDAASLDKRQKSEPAAGKLRYREQQELDALPEKIADLETQIAQLHERMADPDFYKQPGEEIARQTTELREIEQQLADAYHRWEHLEERAG